MKRSRPAGSTGRCVGGGRPPALASALRGLGADDAAARLGVGQGHAHAAECHERQGQREDQLLHPPHLPSSTLTSCEARAGVWVSSFSCAIMRRRHFGSATCSERVLDREVIEVAVFVLSRLLDELAGEEVAIAGIALNVTGEVVGGENVGLGTDVAGGGAGPRPQHATTLVVDRVMIGGPPEEILLERKREVADRADADAGVGTDEVLSPDVVDVPQVRVVIRVERIERADVSPGPVVSARVVELDVNAG